MPTTTANMSLQIPVVGETDYPTSISNSLNSVDTHTHASGSGVQIPTGGIANLAVTAAKIANTTITKDKLAALGQQISASSGLFATSSSTFVDVTNLSVTITTVGRPVFIGLIPDGDTSTGSYLAASSNGGASEECRMAIFRDATQISETLIRPQSGGGLPFNIPPGAIFMIDTPAAGTYTYKVQANGDAFTPPNPTTEVTNCLLIAYEL